MILRLSAAGQLNLWGLLHHTTHHRFVSIVIELSAIMISKTYLVLVVYSKENAATLKL
jgi:hypothetical protein